MCDRLAVICSHCTDTQFKICISVLEGLCEEWTIVGDTQDCNESEAGDVSDAATVSYDEDVTNTAFEDGSECNLPVPSLPLPYAEDPMQGTNQCH